MPRSILIDVTQIGSVIFSLLEEGVVVNSKKSKGQHPDLLLCLDNFMKKNKLSWEKINNLALLEGRGSFSGVRQAAAILNTIHLIKKINVFGLDIRKFSSQDRIVQALEKESQKKHGFLKPLYSGEPNITYPSLKK